MSAGKWLNNIARVIKKKEKDQAGKDQYCLVFERQKDKDGKYKGENPFPLTVHEGDYFQMKRKEDDLAKLVADGKISQELADQICQNVRFEISRAPKKGDNDSGSNAAPNNSTEVPF